MAGIRILGLGSSRGERTVTNEMLAQAVDTSDSWIRSKTGIRSRYFAEKKTNADLAAEAAETAVRRAGIPREQIGFCLVCTFTADDDTPATACSVAARLGLSERILALDLNGACSGFIYGCRIAEGLLAADLQKESMEKPYGLVIGSERISPLMDMEDRGTCVLFGDGAGAAVVTWDETAETAFYGGCIPDRQVLHCGRGSFIEMGGQEVYRFAVSKVPEAIEGVLHAAGRTREEIRWFVCHQANERISDNAARRIGGDSSKFYENLYTYGNTSAASVPIALCQMKEENLLEAGDRIVCTGFGAGLTYGSMLITI